MIPTLYHSIVTKCNIFFHSQISIYDMKVTTTRLRLMFGCLLLCNWLLLGIDYEYFFSPTVGIGVLRPLNKARTTIDQDTFTLFTYMPQTDLMYWICYYIFLLQIICFTFGILCPKFHAICIFLWHHTYHHHSTLIYNGEDFVFRILSFFFCFLPLSTTSISTASKESTSTSTTWPIWPYRLIQIEMCLIYWSTFACKLQGKKYWLYHGINTNADPTGVGDDYGHGGPAMYYVIHLDINYGKLLNPNFLFGTMFSLRLLTYMTLLVEGLIPILIWVPKTRTIAIFTAIAFHLGIDLSMNLNFFHWIMITGWLFFFIQPTTLTTTTTTTCSTTTTSTKPPQHQAISSSSSTTRTEEGKKDQ